MKTSAAAALAAIAILAQPAAGAPTTANRVWVSGHGVDAAGCGAPASPCRSLQYAHDNAVAAGGEIDILDPAGYGAINITKALSIVNDGVGTAGVQATSGDAIFINAGPSDTVYLKGLNIDGVSGGGANGIAFIGGAGLRIVGCVIRHFGSTGILLAPASGSSQFLILDTISADNPIGLDVDPPGGNAKLSGQIDRLTASGNGAGVHMFGNNGSMAFAISDLIASNNAQEGVVVSTSSANMVLTIDDAQLNLNAVGLLATQSAVVHLSRSRLNQNTGYGVDNQTTGAGGVYSMGDNEARDNQLGNFTGVAVTTQSPF